MFSQPSTRDRALERQSNPLLCARELVPDRCTPSWSFRRHTHKQQWRPLLVPFIESNHSVVLHDLWFERPYLGHFVMRIFSNCNAFFIENIGI